MVESSVDSHVVIVGAGIAGLTAAIALDKIGVSPIVIERASALTEAGTALSLWPNALAALGRLGLREDISQVGLPAPAGEVRDSSGKMLFSINQERLTRDPGSRTLIVGRPDLQRLLLDASAHLSIRLNSRARRIVPGAHSVVVDLADGQSIRSSIVLACDGISSISRSLVDNPPLVYRGRSSWRALLADPRHVLEVATLTVGNGKQFITGPLRGGATYWAADVGLPEGANASMTDRRGFLLGAFAGWHAPIPELIDLTANDQLVTADLYDSAPRRLRAGRVGLLGDAAHPMTPDFGQGACQGIEDAVVFAGCLAVSPDPVDALRRYESLRLRRVRRIVRGSRRLGQLATATSPVVVGVRNLVGRHMPPSVNARITAGIAGEAAFERTLPMKA
jgi:2-polyprenyl-6-methoxyphenol hydroxylase-like FAD-dependent oxidoreductase